MSHGTRAYWPTRIILAIGVIATAVAALGVNVLLTNRCFSCAYPNVLGVPADVLMPVLGFVLAVVGLVWMVRIFRGPRDEPPDWRYRDH
jgi:hypothetical protein